MSKGGGGGGGVRDYVGDGESCEYGNGVVLDVQMNRPGPGE